MTEPTETSEPKVPSLHKVKASHAVIAGYLALALGFGTAVYTIAHRGDEATTRSKLAQVQADQALQQVQIAKNEALIAQAKLEAQCDARRAAFDDTTSIFINILNQFPENEAIKRLKEQVTDRPPVVCS